VAAEPREIDLLGDADVQRIATIIRDLNPRLREIGSLHIDANARYLIARAIVTDRAEEVTTNEAVRPGEETGGETTGTGYPSQEGSGPGSSVHLHSESGVTSSAHPDVDTAAVRSLFIYGDFTTEVVDTIVDLCDAFDETRRERDEAQLVALAADAVAKHAIGLLREHREAHGTAEEHQFSDPEMDYVAQSWRERRDGLIERTESA
jgi:hypothetical protein